MPESIFVSACSYMLNEMKKREGFDMVVDQVYCSFSCFLAKLKKITLKLFADYYFFLNFVNCTINNLIAC